MTPDFKDIDREFDKDFPPFIGSGAPFPIFNETPNREHIKDFWHSKLSAAYEQGVEEERGKSRNLVRNERLDCPFCNPNTSYGAGPEFFDRWKIKHKYHTPPQEHE